MSELLEIDRAAYFFKTSKRSLLSKATIATIAAISCLVPKTAIAQLSATPETSCYVEWIAGVQTSLESLCGLPAAPSSNFSNPVVPSPSAAESPTTRVEVVSEVGSVVYVNGLRTSEPTRSISVDSSQTLTATPQTIEEPTFFRYPQTRSRRRYIQHQTFRFHPPQEQQPNAGWQPQEIPLLPPGFTFQQRLF